VKTFREEDLCQAIDFLERALARKIYINQIEMERLRLNTTSMEEIAAVLNRLTVAVKKMRQRCHTVMTGNVAA
jgi:hypothetical protein